MLRERHSRITSLPLERSVPRPDNSQSWATSWEIACLPVRCPVQAAVGGELPGIGALRLPLRSVLCSMHSHDDRTYRFPSVDGTGRYTLACEF